MLFWLAAREAVRLNYPPPIPADVKPRAIGRTPTFRQTKICATRRFASIRTIRGFNGNNFLLGFQH